MRRKPEQQESSFVRQTKELSLMAEGAGFDPPNTYCCEPLSLDVYPAPGRQRFFRFPLIDRRLPLKKSVFYRKNSPIRRDAAPPRSIAAGSVTTHAVNMLPAMPHFTADLRWTEPTPMIDVVMTCVVLTGAPRNVMISITMAEEA